jgi:hypothetical protein
VGLENADGSVIDHRVHAPKAFISGPEEATNVLDLSYVGLDGDGPAPGRLDGLDDFLGLGGVLHVVDDHLGPVPAQSLGDGTPDTSRGARHDRHLAIQRPHVAHTPFEWFLAFELYMQFC